MSSTFSVVRAIRTAIPVLRERGGGSIVNVSTAAARQPAPMNVDYAAAKAGAADIIAAHYASDRDTVITRLVPEKTSHLTGRLIDPQEVADVIVLLASPRSASTTGADFAVDAGFIKVV